MKIGSINKSLAYFILLFIGLCTGGLFFLFPSTDSVSISNSSPTYSKDTIDDPMRTGGGLDQESLPMQSLKTPPVELAHLMDAPVGLFDDGASVVREEKKPGAQNSRFQDHDARAAIDDSVMSGLYPVFEFGVVIDAKGRAALDVFVSSLPEGLSVGELMQVTDIVQQRIPYETGDELAGVISKLYQLRQEEARITQAHGPIDTMDDALAMSARLNTLREHILGGELNKSYNGADNTPPIESVDAHTQVGAGEKSLENLPSDDSEVARNQQDLKNIEGQWQRRYEKFWSEKQYIIDAGLSESDKAEQIDSLLKRHYQNNEVEAARAYDALVGSGS